MNFGEYFQFLLALLFVIGLIGLLALGARRLGFGFPISALKNKEERRLSLIEVLPIDGRRKLVLVKCDSKEHLIILGLNSETIVSSNTPSNSMELKKNYKN